MPSASDFHAAFLRAYSDTRKRYDDDQWFDVWHDSTKWSALMMYNDNAVLKLTARQLDIRYCPWVSEPLRLDVVLVPPHQTLWFPMHVAVEHENEPRNFEMEIRKLYSVRAPLKVGITYALLDHRDHQQIPDKIAEKVRSTHEDAIRVMSEDPETEYLFLLGREVRIGTSARACELEWSSLAYTAETGPGHSAFA
jgi:hypothetical protein